MCIRDSNYTNSAGTKYYYAAENRKGHYEYVHTLTAKGSQVHSILGHNVRGGKGKYFHNLHHVQNALIGKSRCEGCGGSCGSKFNTTSITMKLDGYSTVSYTHLRLSTKATTPRTMGRP